MNRRPKHRLRAARRFGVAAVGVVAVLVGLWFWAVPPIMVRMLHGALRDAGYRDLGLQIVSVSPREYEIAGVALGDDASLTARRVRMKFRIGDALCGRVHEVVIEDAVWNLRNPPSGRPFAPFDELLRAPMQDAVSSDGPLPDLPVASLLLRNCRIELPVAGLVTELVGNAVLEVSQMAWKLELSAVADDQQLSLTATLHRVGQLAHGDVSLSLGGAQVPLVLTGTCDIVRDDLGHGITVELHGDGAPFQVALGHFGLDSHRARVALGVRWHQPQGQGKLGWDLSIATDPTGELLLAGAGWSPGLRGLALSGALSAVGEIATVDLASASTTLRVDDVSLHVGEHWLVGGLSAAVELAGLDPPVTPEGQVLSWRSIRIGELAMLEGSLAFHLRPGPLLVVERARWRVDEAGAMSASGFEFDPGHPTIATTLALDAVPLGGCLDLMSQGRISGTGRISGLLDTRVRLSPDLHVYFGVGHLQSVGEGTLRFMDDPDTQEMLDTHVASAASAGEYQGIVKQRIIDSLKDFAFRELTFDLIARGASLDLRTHLTGKGRTVPQELSLDINLNGFDALVDIALDAKLGLDRANEGSVRPLDASSHKQRLP